MRYGTMLCAVGWVACAAEISEPQGGLLPGPSGGPGDGNGSSGVGQTLDETPGPSPRFIRLTHDQWARTVEDVLKDDSAQELADGFRADSFGAAFIFDNPADLSVDGPLWAAYQRAAAEVATRLVQDGARFEALTEDLSWDEAGARQLAQRLGEGLFRRPVSSEDVELLVDVYRDGRELSPDLAPFRAGVGLMVEAMLQSPLFLYRIEVGEPAGDGVRELSAWELASRLSYFLWNSPPDTALRAAAADESLLEPEVLRSQARRLLASPRAAAVLLDFHEQLLDVSKFSTIGPSAAFFPDVSERLPEFAATENRLFLEMVVQEGSFETLLTSNRTFVNAALADVYGLQGDFDDTFVPVELPDAERRGLFTHVGWLATYATPADPDPIHRGVFLSERMACNHITLPPGDIPPLPDPDGRTNRELVEKHTESTPECAGCHGALINPFGFAFESYDAVGGYRTEDNGFAVDTSGTPVIDGRLLQVSGAMDLMDQMAENPAVHACYTQHWVEYAFGRVASTEERNLIERLAQASLEGTPVRDLVLALIDSRPFSTRVEDDQ